MESMPLDRIINNRDVYRGTPETESKKHKKKTLKAPICKLEITLLVTNDTDEKRKIDLEYYLLEELVSF